jgi:sialidase-1
VLVFSNPAAKTRTQLTVRISADGAATWRDVALLHAGPSAYSSLVSIDAKTVGCFYENGAKRPYERITFARVEVSAR